MLTKQNKMFCGPSNPSFCQYMFKYKRKAHLIVGLGLGNQYIQFLYLSNKLSCPIISHMLIIKSQATEFLTLISLNKCI